MSGFSTLFIAARFPAVIAFFFLSSRAKRVSCVPNASTGPRDLLLSMQGRTFILSGVVGSVRPLFSLHWPVIPSPPAAPAVSGLLSPLKSPTTTAFGDVPTGDLFAGANSTARLFAGNQSDMRAPGAI